MKTQLALIVAEILFYFFAFEGTSGKNKKDCNEKQEQGNQESPSHSLPIIYSKNRNC
jgi:hypothetical protein